MFRTVVAVAAIAIGITAVAAQSDPIAARKALMKNLSAILGTRDNLVCYCPDDPPTKACTLAYYANGEKLRI